MEKLDAAHLEPFHNYFALIKIAPPESSTRDFCTISTTAEAATWNTWQVHSITTQGSHFFRRALHRPSARPSTFIRPLAESSSIHPANVAVTVPGCSGHVPLNVSSTYP